MLHETHHKVLQYFHWANCPPVPESMNEAIRFSTSAGCHISLNFSSNAMRTCVSARWMAFSASLSFDWFVVRDSRSTLRSFALSWLTSSFEFLSFCFNVFFILWFSIFNCSLSFVYACNFSCCFCRCSRRNCFRPSISVSKWHLHLLLATLETQNQGKANNSVFKCLKCSRLVVEHRLSYAPGFRSFYHQPLYYVIFPGQWSMYLKLRCPYYLRIILFRWETSVPVVACFSAW